MRLRQLRFHTPVIAHVESLDAPMVPVSGLITATLISANLWMLIAYGVWSLLRFLH